MKQQVVIFDLGGVVFNWQPLRLIREVFPERARNDEEAARLQADVFQSHHPEGDWAQWDLGRVDAPELARRIAQRLGIQSHEITAFIEALAPHMQVKQDTVALIHALKAAGHRLLYLSNMPETLARWIERDHPFGDWFEDGVFSARSGHVKPSESIYRYAIERLGLQGQSPVFVDDMPRNVEVAQRLGWRSIHFQAADRLKEQLQAWALLH